MTKKSGPDVDEEMVVGESKTMGANTISAGAEDVFIEKDEHQIHYKTLSWQVSTTLILHYLCL